VELLTRGGDAARAAAQTFDVWSEGPLRGW
jgi:hypothetical protein